jgi:CRP-like cAMP-binding protein
MSYVGWAAIIGALCASSLLIGALIGVKARIAPGTVGLLAAFGGGALLSALATELVAPTVLAVSAATTAVERAEESGHLITLVVGCIAGGVIFILLDEFINKRGGYLRKKAYVIRKKAVKQREFHQKALSEVMNIPLFFSMPPEKLTIVLSHMRPRFFLEGETLFSRGDRSPGLFLVRKGFVVIHLAESNKAIEVGHGEIIGEIALLANAPCSADCVAKSDVEALLLSPEDFASVRKQLPELEEGLRSLAVLRLEENKKSVQQHWGDQEHWATLAIEAVSHGGPLPTSSELRTSHAEHKNAAFAIWLGTLLDAIPESLILGIGLMVAISATVSGGGEPTFWAVFPFVLVAGLFLSDLPEALSASQQMKMQGMTTSKILLLWSSLVVVTSLGSAAGALLAGQVDHGMQVFIEGIGAGAMLVMICAAMIPEAAHLAPANLVGMSTLVGFLSPIMFKFLE